MAKRISIALGTVLLICAALYLARRPIAAWSIEYYFKGRGIPASVVLSHLGFHEAVAQIRLGEPAAPDLSVQRIKVTFVWKGLTPSAVSVDLYRPTLRARFDGRTLSFGTLQPLLRSDAPTPAVNPAPPHAAAPIAQRAAPGITVQDARLRIKTPSGSLNITGSGEFSGNRVRRLHAQAGATTLTVRGITVNIRQASLSADPNDRLHMTIKGAATTKAAERVSLRDASAEIAISNLRWQTHSDGNLQIAAQLRAMLSAGELDAAGTTFHALRADILAAGKFDSKSRIDGTISVTANGTMSEKDAQTQAARIPVLGNDPTTRRALAHALRQFSFNVRDVHILSSPGETYVTLASTAELNGQGASLQLSAAQYPLVHATTGIWRGAGGLRLEGPHLPKIAVAIPSYAWQSTADGGTLEATTQIQARFWFANLRNATISADGTLIWRGGRSTFMLSRCAAVAASTIAIQTQSVARNTSLQLCSQPGKPLLAMEAGRTNIEAEWRSLSTRLTPADMALESSKGAISLSQSDDAIAATVAITQARLTDRSQTRRFAPISVSGRIALANGALRGRFPFAPEQAKTFGTVTLTGSTKSGAGRAEIRIPDLAFSPSGLQPKDISPILASLTRAKGMASFTGHAAWTRRGMTSGGTLTIKNMDFVGPLGAMHGANAKIRLTSLAPPRTAPDQMLSVAKADWVTPLTDISATFELNPIQLRLQSASANLANGHVNLGPLSLLFAAAGETEGKLHIHKIDVGALIAASNLADKITASAQISGTIPFHYGQKGLQLVDGHIATDGPSRLSVAPSLWSGGQAAGDPGVVRGFAYQALEHLAIDKMEGKVNSLPNGRLQLLLNIQGYNDPEVAPKAEVGLFALLQGKAFDKSVPLPKNTKVDLTLDMSLNFAELLAAYRKTWAESLAIKSTPP